VRRPSEVVFDVLMEELEKGEEKARVLGKELDELFLVIKQRGVTEENFEKVVRLSLRLMVCTKVLDAVRELLHILKMERPENVAERLRKYIT